MDNFAFVTNTDINIPVPLHVSQSENSSSQSVVHSLLPLVTICFHFNEKLQGLFIQKPDFSFLWLADVDWVLKQSDAGYGLSGVGWFRGPRSSWEKVQRRAGD